VTKVFDDEAPHYVVEVIYGTSQKTDDLRSGEFLIARADHEAYRAGWVELSDQVQFQEPGRVTVQPGVVQGAAHSTVRPGAQTGYPAPGIDAQGQGGVGSG